MCALARSRPCAVVSARPACQTYATKSRASADTPSPPPPPPGSAVVCVSMRSEIGNLLARVHTMCVSVCVRSLFGSIASCICERINIYARARLRLCCARASIYLIECIIVFFVRPLAHVDGRKGCVSSLEIHMAVHQAERRAPSAAERRVQDQSAAAYRRSPCARRFARARARARAAAAAATASHSAAASRGCRKFPCTRHESR